MNRLLRGDLVRLSDRAASRTAEEAAEDAEHVRSSTAPAEGPRPISLLASVRDLDEARDAATAGADLIDLKEPSAGALGGLPIQDISKIVAALRSEWPQRSVSATIGDFDADDHAGRCAQVVAVAGCGVDYVKAGIEPGPHASAALRSLAALGLPSIVIVFLADRGLDIELVEEAATLAFSGLMVDTGDKTAGSLLQWTDVRVLRDLIDVARRHGRLSGVAGSLRRNDLDLLRRLGPDLAGFRGALCDGDRRGRLDPLKVRELRTELRRPMVRG
ncbi:MAG TPA: (5-formylfuran-3-yl)methyl phosphate synthase [Lautropia sp.]|nr:(5-formylfuran-3-yl)methyl phosphate synthase [Lautropia sp.]